MIPARYLPHAVTLVRPAQQTNGYGDTSADYGDAAIRTYIRARLEPTDGTEVTTEGRNAQVSDWMLYTNHPDVRGADRVEHAGITYEVLGPAVAPGVSGVAHHTMARLRTVEG